jgi:hypothetical protein
MAALAISNRADLAQCEAREERYLAIAAKYDADHLRRFGEALGALALALEDGMDDVLGAVFMELELGSKNAGQFFTPFSVCRMMARMSVVDMGPDLGGRDFVTISDPAVGAGAMLIAVALELHEAGIEYQRRIHVTAQDKDERAAHMAYVQLALLGVPAIVIVGDTLRMEQRALWFTPAHILGGWSRKLARREAPMEPSALPQPTPTAPDPQPGPAAAAPQPTPACAPPQLDLF